MNKTLTGRVASLGPAERARTLVASATEVRMGICDLTHEVPRHVVDVDGSLLLLAPAGSPSGVLRVGRSAAPQTVTVTLVDVTNVPQPDRIRGRLRLTGALSRATEPLPAEVRDHLDGTGPVLRLRPERVALAWACEPGDEAGSRWVQVPLEEYQLASADPMVGLEGRWLPHLQRDHPDLLRTLAAHLSPNLGDSVDVRPLALDRFGLSLRLYAEQGHRDVRVGFTRPVACGCDVRLAFADLWRQIAPGDPGFTC